MITRRNFLGTAAAAPFLSRSMFAKEAPTAPVAVVVLIFQRRIVQGLTAGAVKG